MLTKLRVGDKIIVLTGKNKGQVGEVQRLIQKKENRFWVLASGINMKRKAIRPRPDMGIEGGLQTQASPVDISNVAIYNPDSGKADKISFKEIDGKKTRVFRSSGSPIKG